MGEALLLGTPSCLFVFMYTFGLFTVVFRSHPGASNRPVYVGMVFAYLCVLGVLVLYYD